MKELLEFLDKHPIANGTHGVASGALACLVQAIDLASTIAGKLLVLVLFANALMTCIVLLRQFRNNSDQRRQHREQDVDELP